jgi:hypothetical protein
VHREAGGEGVPGLAARALVETVGADKAALGRAAPPAAEAARPDEVLQAFPAPLFGAVPVDQALV